MFHEYKKARAIIELKSILTALYIIYYLDFQYTRSRSSRPEVFCKKGVLRNLTKFTEKHLCQSLFFNKVEKKYIITDWWK